MGSGLSDLFDLTSGVGTLSGSYVAPKAESAVAPWADTCTIDTARGNCTASRSRQISGKFLISFPLAVRNPRS